MSDYSFSSEGLSSDDDRDSYASEISAFNSGESEPERDSNEVELEDVPISATTRSSRRRSARISAEPQLSRLPKVIVVDDSDVSDFEEEKPKERLSRSQRQRPRKVHRAKRTLPLALIPEDVPWKQPESQPVVDPETVENSPSVAFIIIFINTFAELFADLPPYGPQDIERGVKECSPAIELLFLRLLGLVLNRKKEIERGRYSSALSELHALLPVLGVGLQFPLIDWKSKTAFEAMTWDDRLEFLHVLIHWSLANSERVRHHLSSLSDSSTMPWIGMDNDNCRYYLVRGESLEENRDTEFRVYKETNRLLNFVSWRAIAATPQEVSKLAEGLKPQGKSAAKLGRLLADMVTELEESDDRRFKEARRQRRRQDIEQQTMQVLQGEGRYSGRTRGKRVDYSQLAYDRELDAAMRRSSRHSGKVDGSEEWSETAVSRGPTGDRQSRRLRGEITMDIEQVEKELEAAEARGRKRGREQAEKERQERERLEEEQLEKKRVDRERLEKERLDKERITTKCVPQSSPQGQFQTPVIGTQDILAGNSAITAKNEPIVICNPDNTNPLLGKQTVNYQPIDQQSRIGGSIERVTPVSTQSTCSSTGHAQTSTNQTPQLISEVQTRNAAQVSSHVITSAQSLPIQIMNETPIPASAAAPIQAQPHDQRKQYMMQSQWQPTMQTFSVSGAQSPTQALPGLSQLNSLSNSNQVAQHGFTGSHMIGQVPQPPLMNLPNSQPLMSRQQFQYYPGMPIQTQMQYEHPYNFGAGASNNEKKLDGAADSKVQD